MWSFQKVLAVEAFRWYVWAFSTTHGESRWERWRGGWRETRCVVGGKGGGEERGETKQRPECAFCFVTHIHYVFNAYLVCI